MHPVQGIEPKSPGWESGVVAIRLVKDRENLISYEYENLFTFDILRGA